jgi:cytochrome c biogenesis protein CcdA
MKTETPRKRNRNSVIVGTVLILIGIILGFVEWFLYLGAVLDAASNTYPPGGGLLLLALPVILILVGIGAMREYPKARPKTPPPPADNPPPS